MKAPPFGYAKAESLDQLFQLLARHGDEAKVLAGGQSLLATLNMRLSQPALLIDINGLGELAGIAPTASGIRIGALTRHRAVERSPLIAEALPLLAAALPHIGHAAIRNRGTFGGSLAFADPAAELPACCLALGARIEVRGAGGSRSVAAGDFFTGLWETALRPGEIVTGAEIPLPAAGHRAGFAELARRHGDFALAGIAATARAEGAALADLRLVFFGLDVKPVRARAAERLLEGRAPDAALVAAAQAALDDDLDPAPDLSNSGATKRHFARVLLARALSQMSLEPLRRAA